MRFKIAFSFASEVRSFVEETANILAASCGKEHVLYDKFHEAEFARPGLATYLPHLYNQEVELNVVVLSPTYQSRGWTGLEWRAIHDLIQQRKFNSIILARFKRATSEGLYAGDGFLDLDDKTPLEFAELILTRYKQFTTPPTSRPSDMGPFRTTRWTTAEERIDYAVQQKHDYVDLSGLLLHRLPDSLKNVPQLRHLDISHNHLTELPKWLADLELYDLDISTNPLLHMPSWLQNHATLRKLTACSIGITLQKLNLSRCHQLESVDLSFNRIDDLVLPTSIKRLDIAFCDIKGLPRSAARSELLESIVLDGNYRITIQPNEGDSPFASKALRSVSLNDMALGHVPLFLIDHPSLHSLSLSRNHITDLPQWLRELSLRELNLNGNRSFNIPSWFTKLELQNLGLADCSLVEFPRSFAELSRIRDLDISGNSLTTFPSWLAELRGLTRLDLSGNHIRDIPAWIALFSQLQSLNLSRLNITASAKWLRSLTRLQRLFISGAGSNHFLPILGHIPSLQFLDISKNNLSSFPNALRTLSNLVLLNISNNDISRLPTWICELSSLSHLNISDNRLTSLPAELTKLPLATLGVDGNRMSIPRESLILNDPDVIFSLLSPDSRRRLNEIKIVLCGEGGVGKTCLRRALIDCEPAKQTTETPGIDIEEWRFEHSGEEILARIWDFGGQVILHHAHQLFLTNRTLYLLVLTPRYTEEANATGYWLRTLTSLSKDAPILIVHNISTANQGGFDFKGLQERFPSIVGVATVNLQQKGALRALRTRVMREVSKVPQVRDSIPTSWFELKDRVIALQEKTPFLTQDQFDQECDKVSVGDEAVRTALRDMFDSLGVALKYDRARLQGVYILQPEWVTTGIYNIIRAPAQLAANGIISFSDALSLLPDSVYPADRKVYITNMMVEYELALEVQNGKALLIPTLAKDSEGSTGSWKDTLQFVFEYEEIIAGILPRLVIHHFGRIHAFDFWKKGAIFQWGGNRVRVTIEDKGRLWLRADGDPATRAIALNHCCDAIRQINAEYPDISPRELIPDPEDAGNLVLYNDLLEMKKDGVERVMLGGKWRLVSQLLGEST